MKNYGNKDAIELKKDGLHLMFYPWGKVYWFGNRYTWKVERLEGDDWVYCGKIYSKNKRLSYKRMFQKYHDPDNLD